MLSTPDLHLVVAPRTGRLVPRALQLLGLCGHVVSPSPISVTRTSHCHLSCPVRVLVPPFSLGCNRGSPCRLRSGTGPSAPLLSCSH